MMPGSRRLTSAKVRLLRAPAVRRLLHTFVAPLEPEAWVFVLGCYNSGTTLLARLLAAHPEMQGLPKEGAALTPELARPEDFGWTRMWAACRDRMGPPAGDPGAAALRIRRDWALFAASRRRPLVEKSCSNLPRAAWLAEHLRPARLVGIVRNPYAVVDGIRRKAAPRGPAAASFPHGYDAAQAARQWLAASEELERLAASGLAVPIVRYEEFATQPDTVLARIFDHVGVGRPAIAWEEGRLTVGSMTTAVADLNPASLARLSPEDVAAIGGIVGDAAARFGYEPPGHA